jgi:hypothetical protein
MLLPAGLCGGNQLVKLIQDVRRLTAMVFSSYEEKPRATTLAMGYSVGGRCRLESDLPCL